MIPQNNGPESLVASRYSGGERPYLNGDSIALQVGSSRFHARPWQLARASVVFTSAFARENPDDDTELARTQDGAFVIEANPEMFSYYLDMVRSGRFPLFYTDKDGFDRGLYQRLYDFADQIKAYELADWISNRKYEEAVEVNYEIRTCSESPGAITFGQGEGSVNTIVQVEHYQGSVNFGYVARVITKSTWVNQDKLKLKPR